MTHILDIPIGAPELVFQEAVANRLGRMHLEVSYVMETSFADGVFFLANSPFEVLEITQIHKTAGSDGSDVNLQIEKITGTTVPGSGTNLLTNNSDAGFDMKGTASTVQTGVLTSTRADRLLAKGDRLGVDFAGTLTALAGVCVTVTLRWI